MLSYSRSRTIITFIACIVFIYLAIPSFTSYDKRDDQWYLPSTAVNLGLDLRGGVSLLFAVDSQSYIQDLLRSVGAKLRKTISTAEISGVQISDVIDALLIDGVAISKNGRIMNNTEMIDKIEAMLPNICSDIVGRKGFCRTSISDNRVIIKFTDSFINAMNAKIVDQSISIIRRRVDALGTKEIDIQRQGGNSILLQIPGIYDTASIKKLIGTTARLTFHMVDMSVSMDDVLQRKPMPIGVKILPLESQKQDHNKQDRNNVHNKKSNNQKFYDKMTIDNERTRTMHLPVQARPVMSGEMIADAHPVQQSGVYSVQFKMTDRGSVVFGGITSHNIGKPLAIVLDGKIISAPIIKDKIINGVGIISGNFKAKDAADLAIVLRSGALPAKLTILEERTIGPTLGRDSIHSGSIAALIGGITVIVFMCVFYGIWGVIADIALIINFFMIIAALGLIGSTLTLPGIAGIALTLGMAIDANILIFEHMREEFDLGKGIKAAVSAGYKYAIGTILDSNITTVAAATMLYYFSNGSVQGFAITLVVGILCSMFTAVTVTRTVIEICIHRARKYNNTKRTTNDKPDYKLGSKLKKISS